MVALPQSNTANIIEPSRINSSMVDFSNVIDSSRNTPVKYKSEVKKPRNQKIFKEGIMVSQRE